MPVKVKVIMQEPALVVGQDEPLERVARTMLEHQAACVGVVDLEGRLVGVVREEDFGPVEGHVPFTRGWAPRLFGEWVQPETVERDYDAARRRRAAEIMVPVDAATIGEEARLAEALPRLQQGHGLLVRRGDRAVGTLSRRDLLKLISRETNG